MDAEVIVVGAGPVGLMLAGELRLGGAEVLVLERLVTPTAESRASTLHARTMEIFEQRGLLAELGTPPRQAMGHFAGIPLDLSGAPSPHAGLWKVPQARVEELLADWARGLGADIRRGHEVVGLTASGDRVLVRAEGPRGTVEFAARHVAGCDGEDGAVRDLAGIALRGRTAARELLRADVAGVGIRDRRFERLPGGLAIAARRPDGVTRVMVAEHGGVAGRHPGPVTFKDVTAAWERVTGEDVGAGVPLWVGAFGDASLQAERYRAGPVLLAGDAAHRQLPVGGQAINLGLQDAVNLGWKLAAAASGHAPDGLLDGYHDERHPAGHRALRTIEAQARLLLGGPEVEPVRAVLAELLAHGEARDRLARQISGVDVRYGDAEHPLVGARMPNVGTVGALGPLRYGRGVLLDLSADTERRDLLREWARAWAGRVDLVVSDQPTAGLDTALVRPDGHVAWVSDRAADPRPALGRWFGRTDHDHSSRQGGIG
ncbi:FAD-dependent monooxygenase [Actinomadura meridiana]|uniref:FAD-dependent monooxygenase n=1 Tax=Actinomadura meridiana TaxID=559626 RepID=A0ABP8BSE1_9ACTN